MNKKIRRKWRWFPWKKRKTKKKTRNKSIKKKKQWRKF